MTNQQLQQNIVALEQQGASQQEIQSYINSVSGVNQQQQQQQSKKNVVGSFANSMTKAERGFGSTLGQVAANITGTGKKIEQANQKLIESGYSLIKSAQNTNDPERKKQRLELARKNFEQAGVNWQEVLPAIQKTNKQIVGEAAGTALDVLSVGSYGKVVSKLPTALKGTAGAAKELLTAKSPVGFIKGFGKGAVQGAKVGVPLGAAYGITNAMQEGTSTKEGMITGGVVGGVAGGLISGIVGGVSSKLAQGVQKKLTKTQEAVNKVLLGTKDDIKTGLKELSTIDTKGVNTFDDLRTVVGSKIELLAGNVDKELSKNQNLFKLKELAQKTALGQKKIKYNYVDQALKGLREFYKKSANPENEARIVELINKANKDGLSLTEINGIAREFGEEFAKKAFSKKTGEALTSVNAQAAENIRSGLKSVVRSMGGQKTAAIDQQISRLMRIRTLLDKNVEAVNRLQQRVKERGVLSKAIGKTSGVLNTAGSFYARTFLPSNTGLKTMNILDLEKELVKNLKLIQKYQNSSDSSIINFLIKYLRGNKELSSSKGGEKSLLSRVKENQGGYASLPWQKESPKISEYKASLQRLRSAGKNLTGKAKADNIRAQKNIEDKIWRENQL